MFNLKSADFRQFLRHVKKTGDVVYMETEFYDSHGRLIHRAVVTPQELQEHFSAADCLFKVIRYLRDKDVVSLTDYDRGIPGAAPPPLERPTNVCPDIWDSLNPKQQEFVIEHERLHQELRDKNAAAKAAVKAVYDALCK